MPDWILKVFTWLNDSTGLANWALLVTAVVASGIAWRQVILSREIQKEQARPYVVAGMRRVGHGIVELYVKNLGSTAAYDVMLDSSPPLESVSDGDFFVFESLPTLVPNDEWSTIWETRTPERASIDAPKRYDVTLSYSGPFGGKGVFFKDNYVIDWRPYLPSTYIDQKDMHDLVKTLEKIHRSLGVDRHGQRDLVQSANAIAEATAADATHPTPDVPTEKLGSRRTLGRFATWLPFARRR